MNFLSINPKNGALLAEHERLTAEQLSAKVTQSEQAFVQWRHCTVPERAAALAALAQALRAQRPQLARLITDEMGKPLVQSEAEIEKCALLCATYSERAEALLQEEAIAGTNAHVSYQPLGLILGIMPWNFPFWQVCRLAVPALLAGNVVLIKHAENTLSCATALAQLMSVCFPAGAYQNLVITQDMTQALIAHPAIRGVSLTGSERAGRLVAAQAGMHLKKCLLELGGSDPYVVLADADLDSAVAICLEARMINNGQSCIAAKRFIVEAPVYESFTERFVELASRYVCGDPLERATQLGPLARADLRDKLHRQVVQSQHAGAKSCLGGEPAPRQQGFFYPLTVLSDVRPGMAAFNEETFGPVAALIRAENAEEALQLANKSSYGLGAAIFSRDTIRAQQWARYEIEAGLCALNQRISSDPLLPFGGIKNSGFGRELGPWGLREFVNVKTLWF